MLYGVSQSHSVGVVHGDLKAENVLVSSWNWVFLADFASCKPTMLPADNPVSLFLLLADGSLAGSVAKLLAPLI